MTLPPYDLARMAVHDAAAYRRFPGPDFYETLGWIHEVLEPETYLEIGVHGGCSLAAVRPHTVAVGIDPAPLQDDSRIFRLTSAEFFAQHDLRQVLGGKVVVFALIDGLHLFEQALEDLCNLERYAGPNTVIALHDTIPLDRETSMRRRTTEFYTGDVWKMIPFLERHRPELEMITVAAAPTGLTLIRGLDPARDSRSLLAHAAPFAALEFDYFERHHEEFLRLVPNHRAAIEGFCQLIH